MLRSVKNRPLLLYILFVFKLLSNHFFKQRVPETVGIDSVTEFFHIVYKTYDNLAFCKENYADCSQGPIQQSPPQQMHSCLVECGCAHHSGFALVGAVMSKVCFSTNSFAAFALTVAPVVVMPKMPSRIFRSIACLTSNL